MDLPKRKPNRIPGYDYSQNGAYFVTICAKNRKNLFCDLVGARIARQRTRTFSLTKCGAEIDASIQNIPQVYPMIAVEKYVVMPNHIHLLLLILSSDNWRAMRAPTISTVVNQMKGYVTKRIGFSCWQKSFHDHVVRDERDYLKIWQYIDENPLKWEDDCFYEP